MFRAMSMDEHVELINQMGEPSLQGQSKREREANEARRGEEERPQVEAKRISHEVE